ncbi:short-chain dehydrogenase/reductase SDR [Alkalidesulfovibrio alkalitolerans DSM 16529]|uniref:Short-chain dehydrogenase/reductase SDR n=1 Tax=Alkalidesulfovibrio alkalitolerans DSM 16529 TaxID=1121439 RepID=S7TEC2_9BACT|nr:SDR family oxidoreductase [Alkalidesulfovibrio alkalitolerans]EPR35557.1 short-chain dehydrogenase/reductase SDR [Alkalidesulfovibrio alkalitolerans DSM 16529]
MLQSFDLNGKTIVITGGLGQLGRQFTGALLAHGANVAALDLASGPGEAFDAHADAKHRLLYVRADIADRKSLEQALETITERFGVPFGLVNNAALDAPPGASAAENGPFEDYPLASWNKVMEVNATGAFLACQVFGGAMAKAGRGSIANVSSIYGVVSPDQRIYEYRRKRGEMFFKPVAYSASKSSLLNLTRYLATYWGARGVRVNTCVFGGVFNNQDEAFLEGYNAKVPLGRMAEETEYNGAIVFLMSEASAYMTGAELVMDGGFTAW